MNLGRIGLLKNITSVGFIQIANYVFPLITIPIVSRIVGPDKVGVLNFSASFVAYFTLLIGFGFDITATRKVAVDPTNEENRNKVFSEVFISKCLLFAFSVIAFTVALNTIPELKQEKTVAIYTFLTCLATLMTQNWLFQAMQDLPKVAILNLVSKLFFTISILAMVHTKEDYIWQPFVLSLSQVFIAVLSFLWAVKKYNLKFYSVRIKECLMLLWEEKSFFFSLCVINLYTNTNIVVLGLFQDATQVGYYTSAQKLIGIIQAVITIPLAQAIYPYIGKAFGEDYNKGIDIAQKLLPLVFLFTFFSGLAIMIGAPFLIHLLYGEAFAPAVLVCRILAFIPMLIAVGSICGIHVMLNLRMDKEFFGVVCFGAATSVLMNIFLVNKIGFIGSAYTWAVTEFINLCMLLILLKRKGINLFNKEYFLPSHYKAYFLRIKSKIT